MKLRQIKLAIAAVLALAAAGLLFVHFHVRLPGVDERPHVGLAESLADHVIRAAGSGKVVLIAPDVSEHKFPGFQIQLKVLHEAFRKANVRVTATNWVKVDPNRVLRAPPGDFAEILRKLSDGDVIVSLLGPPVLTPEQRARLGEKRPKVFAVCSGEMPRQIDLKSCFTDRLLHEAIISKARPLPALPTSDAPAEWFNHYFQWVTAQNVTDLPETFAR